MDPIVLNRPSDSPTGLVTAMQTRSSLARKETHMRSLDNANGDVGANLGAIDASMDRLLTALGSLGARANRIDGPHDRAATQRTNLQTRLSEVESTDPTETIMELQMQEVAYQAALGANARVIRPSLLDFLR